MTDTSQPPHATLDDVQPEPAPITFDDLAGMTLAEVDVAPAELPQWLRERD